MIPDLRFVIGAVTATALLSFTLFGLVAAVHIAHQSKVSPLEASRLLAYTPDFGHQVNNRMPSAAGPFAGIPADPNLIPLRQAPSEPASPSIPVAVNSNPVDEPPAPSVQAAISPFRLDELDSPATHAAIDPLPVDEPVQAAISSDPVNEPAPLSVHAVVSSHPVDEPPPASAHAVVSSHPVDEPSPPSVHAVVSSHPAGEPAPAAVHAVVSSHPAGEPAPASVHAVVNSDRIDQTVPPSVQAAISSRPVAEPMQPAVQASISSDPVDESAAIDPSPATNNSAPTESLSAPAVATLAIPPIIVAPQMERNSPATAHVRKQAPPNAKRTARKTRRQAHQAPNPIDPFATTGYPVFAAPRPSISAADRPPRGFQAID